MNLDKILVKDITALGTSGFAMSVTNGAVQIVCNATLSKYGGELYCVYGSGMGFAFFMPSFSLNLFTSDQELIRIGIPAMRIYFCGIFMMALQFAGQSTFVALNRAKQAVFFSLLRKVIIVIPLTMLLPMLITVWPVLKKASTRRK